MSIDIAQVATEQPDVAAGQEFFGTVLSRAATDRAFRQQLIASPHAALAAASGKPESAFAGVDVAFIENEGAATIVLPKLVDETAELSEAQLESVAGGSEPVTAGTLLLIGACALVGTAIGYIAYSAGNSSGDDKTCTQ